MSPCSPLTLSLSSRTLSSFILKEYPFTAHHSSSHSLSVTASLFIFKPKPKFSLSHSFSLSQPSLTLSHLLLKNQTRLLLQLPSSSRASASPEQPRAAVDLVLVDHESLVVPIYAPRHRELRPILAGQPSTSSSSPAELRATKLLLTVRSSSPRRARRAPRWCTSTTAAAPPEPPPCVQPCHQTRSSSLPRPKPPPAVPRTPTSPPPSHVKPVIADSDNAAELAASGATPASTTSRASRPDTSSPSSSPSPPPAATPPRSTQLQIRRLDELRPARLAFIRPRVPTVCHRQPADPSRCPPRGHELL